MNAVFKHKISANMEPTGRRKARYAPLLLNSHLRLKVAEFINSSFKIHFYALYCDQRNETKLIVFIVLNSTTMADADNANVHLALKTAIGFTGRCSFSELDCSTAFLLTHFISFCYKRFQDLFPAVFTTHHVANSLCFLWDR